MFRSPIRPALLVALAASACAASNAVAAPTHPPAAVPAAPSARIQIADGGAKPLVVLVPITERGPSRVEARSDSAFYRVSLSRDGPPQQDALLRFDIERSAPHGNGNNDVRVSVSVRMKRGTSVVLAKLARPDGVTTTITAALE